MAANVALVKVANAALVTDANASNAAENVIHVTAANAVSAEVFSLKFQIQNIGFPSEPGLTLV